MSKQKEGEAAITFTYDSNGNLIKQSNGLEFLYDHTGVFAVKYDNATYYYRKNAQNDIIALLDNSGNVVVKYKYDAWGKCLTTIVDSSATTIAELNPFRYRSYYLDTETNLYFLKTRHYDPETGRFMTIDDISYLDPESINGLNLYAYCLNNPVMMIDNSGCAPAWWQWLVSGLTLAAGIALCFVPGGQAFGVGLIVAGATSMTSNILSAAGVNVKTATIVTNVLSIVGGIALCFTPFAAIGASMIGSGVLGIAGGYVSEAFSGSFELGSAIGNIVGGIVGSGIYKGISALASIRTSHPIGAAFNPKQSTQIGVDPFTLKINRVLNPDKLAAVEARLRSSGMYGVIEVMRDGTIIDGNHRVAIARILKIAVDVIIR